MNRWDRIHTNRLDSFRFRWDRWDRLYSFRLYSFRRNTYRIRIMWDSFRDRCLHRWDMNRIR
jgi:hypothetical protein